jgi:hypothetical protein
MRKTSETASGRAFQFFKIDPSKPGAHEKLHQAMLQHFFGPRGRPRISPLWLRVLIVDCDTAHNELEQASGHSPTKLQVAKEVKRRYPDKYRDRTVEYIRQHWIGSPLKKMTSKQLEDYWGMVDDIIYRIDPVRGAIPHRVLRRID